MIKIEGGTDFDLQVLEVPVAPAAAGGDANSGGGGGGDGGAEKSQGDPRGGNAQTGLEVKRSVMEEGEDTKDSDKVKKTETALGLHHFLWSDVLIGVVFFRSVKMRRSRTERRKTRKRRRTKTKGRRRRRQRK